MNAICSLVPSLRCVLVDFTAHGMKGMMTLEDGCWKELSDAECRVVLREERLHDVC